MSFCCRIILHAIIFCACARVIVELHLQLRSRSRSPARACLLMTSRDAAPVFCCCMRCCCPHLTNHHRRSPEHARFLRLLRGPAHAPARPLLRCSSRRNLIITKTTNRRCGQPFLLLLCSYSTFSVVARSTRSPFEPRRKHKSDESRTWIIHTHARTCDTVQLHLIISANICK